MKPGLLDAIAVALGLTLAFQAGCEQQAKVTEEPAPAAAKPSKSGPRIEFESTVYDFGRVGPGQKLAGEFKFTNTGDTLLKITKVEKCCGAVTRLDKTEFEPGETGVLKVQYTSSRTAHKTNKKLYVSSNDKANPRATLTILAETVLRVDYDPKDLRLVLNKENGGCPKITLTSTDNKPFSITSFESTGGCLTADFDPHAKATKFVLEPKVDMEKLQKSHKGLISVSLAFAQADTPPETFNIYFTVLPRFTVSPLMLICLYDKSQKSVMKSLWIVSNYGKDFDVETTTSKEGHIKVLSTRKLDNRQQFVLEITPPSGRDVKRFTDTFTITLKDGERLDVPCRGIYKAPTPKKTAG
jgi:Protein of unknown function (DUF1573)